MNNILKYIIIASVAVIAVFFLMKNKIIKNKGTVSVDITPTIDGSEISTTDTKNVLPYPQVSNQFASQGNFTQNFANLECFPKDQLKAKDLLPTEDGYKGAFEDASPTGQGHLSYKNFIESGHHYGINTVSSTLKNPNTQLRSDPIIPQKETGPWLQSTYEPDTNRKHFEIGEI